MRKQSFGKVLFATMMMVCMVFLLSSGIAQAQCTDSSECQGGWCVNNFCAKVCGDDNDCNNGRFCDGEETCVAGLYAPDPALFLCQPGAIPCGADFCDEAAAPGYQCVECTANADCFGGVCRLSDNVCVECDVNEDCDNGRYCDGQETCVSNVCILGDIPCAGQFCNEAGGSCLTCDDDADCHGLGTCVANQCVECTNNADCDNGLNCDGAETCEWPGVCLPGPAPCGADFCNETDGCVQCTIDDDCYGLGVCEGNVCVECRDTDGCDNGQWCDGLEQCVNNQCEPGNIRCSGEFCNETGESCLTCDDDADCHGLGKCVANECVECTEDSACDNGRFCDGVEYCDLSNNVCVPGDIPCSGQFCNETGESCLTCDDDADCHGLGECVANECVECTENSDCSNGLWCDGEEGCSDEGVCEAGDPRCDGAFCNETADNCYECNVDGDCKGGRCINNVCFECRYDSDCNNDLFCDGEETCNADLGVCELGVIPCAGQFCNETQDTCLTCLEDTDCFGGVCEGNVCFECRDNAGCDNLMFCDGVETCNAGECVTGEIPCAGDYCNETAAGADCQQCIADEDCIVGDTTGRCINKVCFDCFGSEDCDNGLFCDGTETCEAGICQLGEIPCAGEFCNEADNSCLTCVDDTGCHGLGMCVDNMCVECTGNEHCDNGLYCDGEETCNAGVCVAGDIPCAGDYCDEDDGCQACVADADCFGGGRCINNVCFECRLEADCNNNLFCDGLERCEDNVCVLGEIPCAGKFCDEGANSCLTCLGDNDCFGGKCVDNVCVECTEDSECNNGQFCDGVETCDAGVCRAGTAPCAGQTCDETDDACMPCAADSDCGEFFSCENTVCVAYPTDSPVTTATLKGPGLLEIIFYPNRFDIASIKLMKTTEKSAVTITSKLKGFPVSLTGLAVDGSLNSLKGKNVILNGPLTATGGIDKIQIQGAETGCSIEAPWIDTVSIAGDFSCDMMLTGAGSSKNWLTLGKLSIKGRLSDSELLITGDVGSANVGFWGAGGTLAVGVEAGPDGEFFTNDDAATEGELGNFKFKEYETLNDGEAFGIIANEFKNPKTLLPFDESDFHIRQVQ